MLTVRTSENTVITSFRLISERQDFSSVRTGENTVRARARIQAQIVNFTTKTQYIFRINKDSLDLADVKKVNQYIPQDERRVPFRRMVYFGDGDTDVPCMKLVKAEGGFSIAVYPERKKAKASQLLMDNRCSYIAPTDYSPEKKLENLAFGIIDLIAAQENLNKLVEK